MKKAIRIAALSSILSLAPAASTFAIPASVIAKDSISVTIDGKTQNYDQPPVMVNEHILVPLRGIFESLGASITWNNDTQTIKAVKEDTTIVLQMDSNVAQKNGQSFQMDARVQLVNGHTMVPIRFVSEALGADVRWDGNTNAVIITTQNGLGSLKGDITFQNSDFFGTKPDAGAKIILIAKNFDKNSTSSTAANELSAGVVDDSIKNLVFTATTDDFGHYEINRIPAGDYLLLVSSGNTPKSSNDPSPSDETNLLKSYIPDSAWKNFSITYGLDLKKHEVTTIHINANQKMHLNYFFNRPLAF